MYSVDFGQWDKSLFFKGKCQSYLMFSSGFRVRDAWPRRLRRPRRLLALRDAPRVRGEGGGDHRGGLEVPAGEPRLHWRGQVWKKFHCKWIEFNLKKLFFQDCHLGLELWRLPGPLRSGEGRRGCVQVWKRLEFPTPDDASGASFKARSKIWWKDRLLLSVSPSPAHKGNFETHFCRHILVFKDYFLILLVWLFGINFPLFFSL